MGHKGQVGGDDRVQGSCRICLEATLGLHVYHSIPLTIILNLIAQHSHSMEAISYHYYLLYYLFFLYYFYYFYYYLFYHLFYYLN